MPVIVNHSLADVKNGMAAYNPGSVLIQIVDPGAEFPEPKYPYHEVHRFEFLDADEDQPALADFLITEEQASKIVAILVKALDEDRMVVVHCVAGLCRSGAVVEVGTIMGFEDPRRIRHPNIYVKRMLIRALGKYWDQQDA